jgi:exodeoxyribonuclease V gamma subunit
VPQLGEIPNDSLPSDLDGLGAWALKERLIAGLADGYDMEQLQARERSSDGLPPGLLGADDLERATQAATDLWNAAVERGYDREAMQPYRGSVPVGGLSVEGTVLADPDRAHLFTVTASTVKAKHRLRSFTELAFLSALRPEAAWTSILLGRRGRGHVAVTIGPIGATPDERRREATARLTELVALYIEGHGAPIAMPCETAYAWQRNVGSDRGRAWGQARDAWETDRYSPEADDPAHQLLLPELRPMRALLGAGLERYCKRLWGPILPLTREVTL